MDRIVRLTGDIDCATGPVVESQLVRALSESGADLVADLDAVSFLDCAGLGSLIAVHHWATARGLRFRIARPAPAVRRLLDTVDEHVLDLVADADEGDAPGEVRARRTGREVEALAPLRPMRPLEVPIGVDEMAHQLDETSEELRVADEEMRAQHELIDGLLRDRSAERLAGVRLMAALPVAVVETDRGGLVLQANPAATALLEVESGRLRGKPLAVMVESADRRALRSALARVVTGGGTERLAVFLTSRRHGALPVEIAVIGGVGPAGTGPAGRAAPVRDPARDAPAARFVIVPPEWARSGPDAALVEAVSSLSALSATEGDLRVVLSRIAELAVSSIGPAVASGITVGSPADPAILVSTGELAQNGHGDQFAAGAGPSWDAHRAHLPVTSLTMHSDERWPVLRARTPAEVDGVAAVPLSGGREVVGVLTVYGTLGVTTPPAVQRAGLFADAATAVLREHHAVAELREQEAQLREALSARAVIDQAKGILMARRGIDAEAAFAELVTQSQTSNVKLPAMARRLVADVSRDRAPARGSDATA